MQTKAKVKAKRPNMTALKTYNFWNLVFQFKTHKWFAKRVFVFQKLMLEIENLKKIKIDLSSAVLSLNLKCASFFLTSHF